MNKAEKLLRWRTILRRADQVAAGTIIGLSLLAIISFWLHKAGHRGGMIEIDRGDAATFQFQVDVNAADWPELTLLPNVGETIARRIVQHREQNGPFTSYEDLLAVSGIGPKTLDRIRPFLRPLRHPVPGTATSD